MNKLTLLSFASAAVLCAQFTPDPTTRLSHQIPGFSPAGERKMQRRDVYLNGAGKNGPIKRRLTVAFEPVTGYFLSSYQALGNLDPSLERDPSIVLSDSERTTVNYAAYVSDRGILLFKPATIQINGHLTPVISYQQSAEKAARLDDAERQAIQTLAANAPEASRANFWPAPSFFQMADPEGKSLLGDNFYFQSPGGVPGPISVLAIAGSPEGWVITLESAYKARVTLSPSFQPLKAEPVDPKSPLDPPSLHHSENE